MLDWLQLGSETSATTKCDLRAWCVWMAEALDWYTVTTREGSRLPVALASDLQVGGQPS